jgi:hypothetical protein
MKQVNTTRIGRKWEIYAHQHLFPESVLVTNSNRNAPYDLLNGTVRINVKASRLYTKKHGRYFDFLLRRCREECDYFLFVGYARRRDKEPLKVWMVPANALRGRERLTLGPNHAGEWKDFEVK